MRQPVGIGDHQPAQPQQMRPHQRRREVARQNAEVLAQVLGAVEAAAHQPHQLVDLVGGGQHDLGEQLLLVAEVLVDGRLDTAASAAISSIVVPR